MLQRQFGAALQRPKRNKRASQDLTGLNKHRRATYGVDMDTMISIGISGDTSDVDVDGSGVLFLLQMRRCQSNELRMSDAVFQHNSSMIAYVPGKLSIGDAQIGLKRADREDIGTSPFSSCIETIMNTEQYECG